MATAKPISFNVQAGAVLRIGVGIAAAPAPGPTLPPAPAPAPAPSPAPSPESLPSWVPASHPTEAQAVVLTVANGRLANNAASVCAPYYDSFRFPQIFLAYSGGTFNPHWGSFGAMHYFGTGHAGGNDNTVATLAIGEICDWRRSNDPSPIFGTGTDATTRGNNAFADFSGLPHIDPATCTYPVDGQQAGPHSYGLTVCLPPAPGAPQGRLFSPVVAAASRNQAVTTSAVSANRLNLDSAAASSVNKWVHLGVHPTLPFGEGLGSFFTAPGHSVFDAPRNRTVYWSRNPGPVRWYDHAASAFVDGTGAQLNASDFGTIAAHVAVHIPERNLMLAVYRKAGGAALGIKWMDLSAAQPGWVNTGASLSASINVDVDWSSAAWCADLGQIVVGDLQGNRASLALISVPANLSGVWPVTTCGVVAAGGSASFENVNWRASGARTGNNSNDYGKWHYNPALKGFVHFNHWQPAGQPDTVVFIRLPGV